MLPGSALYIHLMMALGVLMTLLFLHLYFVLWRRFRGGNSLAGLGRGRGQTDADSCPVTVNLAHGLVAVAIGGNGRYWT